MNTLESEPMGMLDRLKTAGSVVATGKLPNPLAEAPKDPSRAQLVQDLTDWIKDERKFWKPMYELMREEQRFAAGDQWNEGYECKGDTKKPYIGDIVQQLVNRVVASLYAKNPTPDAKRLEKMLYEKWDGTQESLRGAQAIKAQYDQVKETLPLGLDGQPVKPPQVLSAEEILDDYERGMAEKSLLDKMAETASLLIKHRWKTHKPDFKVMMKQAVTQAVVSRVAFMQVDYQRDMEQSPNTDSGVTLADKLATMRQKMQALEESDEKDTAALREELRLLMSGIQQALMDVPEGGEVISEGTVYQLIPPSSLIIDRKCTCLWEFLGARRIARQTLMDVSAAERRFGVSLKDCGAVMYGEDGCEQTSDIEQPTSTGKTGTTKPKVCIWHLYDKDAQLCYVICDGVKDFLPMQAGEPNEPYAPQPALERFWPIVPITLNAQVVEKNEPEFDVTIYPRSHVRLQMPMQQDINKAGEGLREHRVANRPGMVAVKSKFGENDLAKLAGPRNAHDVDLLENLNPGEKITDFIQPRPSNPIDPKLYDSSPSLQAAMLATGLQPANLGAQSGGEKATGQAIAEGARISADQSNVDGVDFALTVLAQCTWEMEIQETSEHTVKRTVGRGAMWPQISRADAQAEIFLEVEAGSSGQPNQEMEAQKFERIVPLALPLFQALGVRPDVLLKAALKILNIKLDVDDLLKQAQMMAPQVMGQLPAPGQAGPPGGPLPAGGVAPGVAPNGTGAPPVPPQQQQQMNRSMMP